MAAAKQSLINAIENAKPGSDTSEASSALANVDNVLKISKSAYDKENTQLDRLSGLRSDLLDQEIAQARAAGYALAGSWQEVLNRIKASNEIKMGGEFASFGLSGSNKDTFLNERAGIKNDESLSKKDQDKEIASLRKVSYELEIQQTQMEGVAAAAEIMRNGFADAFAEVINGTKSASAAFGQLAVDVLKEIQRMILKMLILKAISYIPGIGPGLAAFLGPIMGAAGGVIPMATGGIMDRANGGLQSVVKQPTYLVGEGRYNEAVVPLPNGRSIPVQMHGGSSSNSNVAVTVNMTNSGTQTESSGPDPNKMGQAIAAAVQRELVAQKAPGGLLSKYGA
jgi:hypothetical protein